jgi:TM2 domain-containing membrane protein YozV
MKSKLTAGLLGLFLGTFGIHKFYLGKTTQGIIYILLS